MANKEKKEKGIRKAYFVKVRITFITPLLGTSPNNKETYSEYIAKLATKESREEEVERLSAEVVDDKGMTVFLRNPQNGLPVMKDYTWQGFLKARGSAIAKIPNSLLAGQAAYLKEVNDLIYVQPRFADIHIPEGAEITSTYIYGVDKDGNPLDVNGMPLRGEDHANVELKKPEDLTPEEIQLILEGVTQHNLDTLQRPLRANGAQGERVALSKSETIPVGSYVDLTFRTERQEGLNIIKSTLNFGFMHGTGQWRNAGYGRFVYDILDMWSEEIDERPWTDDDFPVRNKHSM